MFYGAQSMRDSKWPEIAKIMYQKRFDMGGWNEEAYMSMLHLATSRFFQSDFGAKTIHQFLQAYEKCPHRLEAPYYLVKLWRLEQQYHTGWNFARGLINLRPNSSCLFLDLDITEWGFFEEAGLCAFYAGDKKSFRDLSSRVLESKRTPEDVRKRVQNNLDKFGSAT